MDPIYKMAILFKKDSGNKKHRIPAMPTVLEETPWVFFMEPFKAIPYMWIWGGSIHK